MNRRYSCEGCTCEAAEPPSLGRACFYSQLKQIASTSRSPTSSPCSSASVRPVGCSRVSLSNYRRTNTFYWWGNLHTHSLESPLSLRVPPSHPHPPPPKPRHPPHSPPFFLGQLNPEAEAEVTHGGSESCCEKSCCFLTNRGRSNTCTRPKNTILTLA